jgi:hypothetical protein
LTLQLNFNELVNFFPEIFPAGFGAIFTATISLKSVSLGVKIKIKNRVFNALWQTSCFIFFAHYGDAYFERSKRHPPTF